MLSTKVKKIEAEKEIKQRNFSLLFWKEFKKYKPEEYKQSCNIKVNRKASKKVMNHTYRIQKSEVRKRMKRNRKRAELHNKNKVPLTVRVKKWIHG